MSREIIIEYRRSGLSMRQLDGRPVSFLLNEARTCFSSDIRRGLGALLQAIKLNPVNSELRKLSDDYFAAFRRETLAHRRAGKLENALDACRCTLRINPKSREMGEILEELQLKINPPRPATTRVIPYEPPPTAVAPPPLSTQHQVPIEVQPAVVAPSPPIQDVEIEDSKPELVTDTPTKAIKPPASRAKAKLRQVREKLEDTGIGTLLEMNELLSGAKFFFDTGYYSDAFSCAAELVIHGPTVLEASELAVAIFRKITGWRGPITARTMRKNKLSAVEQIARIAERRIFVVEYLRGLSTEERIGLRFQAKGHPLLNLIGSKSFNVFRSLTEAAEAGAIELPSRKAKEKPLKPEPQKPLPWPKLEADIQVEKDRIQKEAEAHFIAGEYANAAEMFREAIGIDPNDIEAFCFGHLSALMNNFPFLKEMPLHFIGIVEQRPAVRVRRRLFHRIGVIRFLKRDTSLNLAELRRLKEKERGGVGEDSRSGEDVDTFSAIKVYSSVAGPKSVKIFDSFTEAHLASGLGGYFPDVLDKVKREIAEEFMTANGLSWI